jgi:predicted transposase YbfD/YdcC
VKNNQPTLFEDCAFTSDTMKPDDQFIAPVEKGRNRIEYRSAFIFKEFFATDPGWDHAKELVVIRRIRQVFSTTTKKWNEAQETSFYISTTSLNASEYMHAIRVHWAIENKNHHVKDVTLVEDASRIRINPGNFAKLRSWALGILRINQIKNVSKALYENTLNISAPLSYSGCYDYFEQPWRNP